jgi:MYXO-CTERM domain-containing protein
VPAAAEDTDSSGGCQTGHGPGGGAGLLLALFATFARTRRQSKTRPSSDVRAIRRRGPR